MKNEYQTYYLRDLLLMIDRAAMDCMMCPRGISNLEDMDNTPLINNNIAWNNEGIRSLATRLKDELIGEDEADG